MVLEVETFPLPANRKAAIKWFCNQMKIVTWKLTAIEMREEGRSIFERALEEIFFLRCCIRVTELLASAAVMARFT